MSGLPVGVFQGFCPVRAANRGASKPNLKGKAPYLLRGTHLLNPSQETLSVPSILTSEEPFALTMIQPEYVRIASSCDFGSVQRESGLPPPYYWTTTPEKDHLPDVLRTVEDTLHELDPELRRLSLDIHGERDCTRQTLKETDTRFRPP
jgi:hypothetical protein